MYNFTESLYDYFLKDFSIICNGDIVYTGKLRLISNKDFYIIFSYADTKGKIKTLEIPYPYNVKMVDDDVFELDYTIDTMCNIKTEFNKLKYILLGLNQDNKHKFYNSKVYLNFKISNAIN